MQDSNSQLVYRPEKEPYLVYGLDLGIGSCGWAVLDLANKRVVALNSLIFPVPQAPKTGQSLAAGRGADRRRRRTLRRKRAVLRHCLKLIDEYGLLEIPKEPNGDINVTKGGQFMQRRKGEKDIVDLRVEGLDRLLSNREFARVLYSLAGHRGYIPHGEGSGKDSDAGKVLSAVEENSKYMEENGCRTVGEMFLKKGKLRNKGGDYSNCVLNADLCHEIHLIFEAQRSFGNDKLVEDFEKRFIDECMQYLKNLSEQESRIYDSVAMCTYFPELKAAPSSSPSSEREIAYERLTNIRIENEDGTKDKLSNEIVQSAINAIFDPKGKGKYTYSKLRKLIGLSARRHFLGVKDDEESTKEIFDAKAWKAFKKSLSGDLLLRMIEVPGLGDAIAQAVTYSFSRGTLELILSGESKTKIPDEILEPLGELTDSEIDEILELPFSSKTFSGYGRRSLRALRLILDEFEQGEESLSEIEENTGLKNKRLEKPESKGFLEPYCMFDTTCKNPVVLRSMSKMRSVVNALIKRYGRPSEIHVELTRDLKNPKSVKDEILKANNARNKKREAFRECASQVLGCDKNDVPWSVLDKLLMLEEQNDKDPYTSEVLDKIQVIKDPMYSQIDHIIPYSRSFDDSYGNKVLVAAKSNQEKKQMSPYEWFGKNEARWSAFCAQVCANKNYSSKKRRMFKCLDVDAEIEGFLNRNGSDTAYLTRQAALWLENTLEFAEANGKEVHVTRTSGKVTGKMRKWWGLSKKDRDLDNRHHAVDAACIAGCTQALMQKTAIVHATKRYTKDEDYKEAIEAAMPWPGFAEQVEALAEKCIPARAPRRNVTGLAFEETDYKLLGIKENGQALLAAKSISQASKPSGNYRLTGNGAKILGGMAFLQLWWDPESKKGKGQWIADPVYYADIPFLLKGSYVPKRAVALMPRNSWPAVPESALNSSPIKIFFGDLLIVKGELRVFAGFSVSAANWVLAYPDRNISDKSLQQEAKRGITIANLRRDQLRIVDNAPLGFAGENLDK